MKSWLKRILNSKGTVYYGCHFYPGVAEYQEPGKEPYRVFLNEDTIRSMDPTFAGRPVFVMHVDGVDDKVDELRKEADGWVVESFYNQADGKHWVKFLVVSERGERAIRNGMKLSNCYAPRGPFGQGGLWNGVKYEKEIKGGEYEHLAIVPNPRYEESVILTPEQFKKYNEDKIGELKRLANEKGLEPMLKLFKRTKVENSADMDGLEIMLEKSGKVLSISQLAKEADERYSNSPMAAHPEHLVDMGDGAKMTVNDLLAKHKALCDELGAMKKKNEEDADKDDDSMENEEGEDDDSMENEEDKDDDSMENEDDEAAKKKALKLAEHEDKEIKEAKKKNAKEKADRLRNAHLHASNETARIDLPEDRVARGRTRYGS